MIIARLIGGLGNQMFQYAVGRRAACVNNTILKLDITGYEEQEEMTPREYQLNIFNIQENFASPEEITKLKTSFKNINIKYFRKIYRYIFLRQRRSRVREKQFNFDPNILKVPDNVYLEGFWASEKYFQDIEYIIRQEFTFKKKPDGINKKIVKQIEESQSISIHIRRGDYVFDKKTSDYHGACGFDYYSMAAETVVKKITNPHFFIFSDDPEWVKEKFHLKYQNTIIDNNILQKDYEDLRLMSLCEHNIIANSSFSWWGAWLNRNSDKIVITPKKWFADSSIDTNDLIPQGWIRL